MNAKKLFPLVTLCMVAWAGVAAAYHIQARGPIWDDANTYVRHTTYYYCNGDYHAALDISNGTCGTWNERGMLVGSFYWNVVSGCGGNCASTPQTCPNYAYVNGANGFRFMQYHHNNNVSSYSRTCDRCAIGLIGATGQAYGAHSHGQHNQYSTALTGWYTGYVTCGSRGGGGYTMGWVAMQ